jgi:hypothetical protein
MMMMINFYSSYVVVFLARTGIDSFHRLHQLLSNIYEVELCNCKVGYDWMARHSGNVHDVHFVILDKFTDVEVRRDKAHSPEATMFSVSINSPVSLQR